MVSSVACSRANEEAAHESPEWTEDDIRWLAEHRRAYESVRRRSWTAMLVGAAFTLASAVAVECGDGWIVGLWWAIPGLVIWFGLTAGAVGLNNLWLARRVNRIVERGDRQAREYIAERRSAADGCAVEHLSGPRLSSEDTSGVRPRSGRSSRS